MKKGRDPVPWKDMGRFASVLGVALALYTVGVALASSDQLLGWLNTLMATVLSVFSALVVGLVLFRFQTKETDGKKREELAALLEAELTEFRGKLLESRTVVPDEILEDRCPSAFHEIRLGIHHPRPLVIEEAIRSGLFGAEQTASMLVLARDMKAHNLFLREATSLEPHMDRAWAAGLESRPSREEFFRLLRRYAQAVRMVQLSEESILAGCGEVLEGRGMTLNR